MKRKRSIGQLCNKLFTPNIHVHAIYCLVRTEEGPMVFCFLFLSQNLHTFLPIFLPSHCCQDTEIVPDVISSVNWEESCLSKDTGNVDDDSDVVKVNSDVLVAAAVADSCIDHSMACCNMVMPQDTTFCCQPKWWGSKARQVVWCAHC